MPFILKSLIVIKRLKNQIFRLLNKIGLYSLFGGIYTISLVGLVQRVPCAFSTFILVIIDNIHKLKAGVILIAYQSWNYSCTRLRMHPLHRNEIMDRAASEKNYSWSESYFNISILNVLIRNQNFLRGGFSFPFRLCSAEHIFYESWFSRHPTIRCSCK